MTMTATADPTRLDPYCRHRRLPVYDSPTPVVRPVGAHSTDSTDSTDRTHARRGSFLGRALLDVVIGVLAAALVLALSIGFGGGAAATGTVSVDQVDQVGTAAPAAALVSPIEVYVVQPGDSLWTIAERLVPTGADVRPAVDHLRDVAGSSRIEIGQRLTIDHTLLTP